jgi:hypothetical protein
VCETFFLSAVVGAAAAFPFSFFLFYPSFIQSSLFPFRIAAYIFLG